MCVQSETQRPFKRQMKFFKTIKLTKRKQCCHPVTAEYLQWVGHRAGSIVSILDLFLFDSCLQISEWECVKRSPSLYLMFTFIWEANWSYVLKWRHRFLICINVYPSCSSSRFFLRFESYVINTYPFISKLEFIVLSFLAVCCFRCFYFWIRNVLLMLIISLKMITFVSIRELIVYSFSINGRKIH